MKKIKARSLFVSVSVLKSSEAAFRLNAISMSDATRGLAMQLKQLFFQLVIVFSSYGGSNRHRKFCIQWSMFIMGVTS